MKTLKLNYITSTDDLRPSLNYIQFNENGFIYATNAHVLIKTTMVDALGAEFEPLKELWDKLCKVLMEADNKAIVQFMDRKSEYTVTFLTGDFEAGFPKCEAVIPTASLEAIDKIGIDGTLFNQLTMCVKSSVNTTQFKLEFRSELRGIILTHLELENTTFLLMPFKVSEV